MCSCECEQEMEGGSVGAQGLDETEDDESSDEASGASSTYHDDDDDDDDGEEGEDDGSSCDGHDVDADEEEINHEHGAHGQHAAKCKRDLEWDEAAHNF